MCGFLVYTESGDNSKIKLRGPDCTTEFRAGGLTFVHNLLHVTGAFTPQPFVDDDVVCLYNGEIYNQPFRQSDGEVLIPLYRQLGLTLPAISTASSQLRCTTFANRLLSSRLTLLKRSRSSSTGSNVPAIGLESVGARPPQIRSW